MNDLTEWGLVLVIYFISIRKIYRAQRNSFTCIILLGYYCQTVVLFYLGN